MDGAYDKCFGNDYDFDDLAAAAGGSDKDSDGLPDSFEGTGSENTNKILIVV